jgi:hypothetical protein
MNPEVIKSRHSTVASQHGNADSSNALAKHGYLILDQFTSVCQNEIVKRDLSWTYQHQRAIDTTRRLTNKNVLPTAIIPFEIQAVLPKVGRDGSVRLQVHVVRIPRPRIAAEA